MNLIHACQESLQQTERLLRRLGPVQFTAAHASCFGASIGQHVRHCLDHFEQFLDGAGTGCLDYDSRKRNTAVEQDLAAALAHTRALRKRLDHLGGRLTEEQPVQVRIDCGGPGSSTQPSSVGRELQFLISHTVHHFAIIGIMCHSQNIPLEPDFGVAPSTVRHRNTA